MLNLDSQFNATREENKERLIQRRMKGTCWPGVDALRFAIRLFVVVILLGYLMIWIMMPTNTLWLHWMPDIDAKTDDKYLEQQGLVFLYILNCRD